MANQFGAPISDVLRQSPYISFDDPPWFQVLDEVTPSDADFASIAGQSTNPYYLACMLGRRDALPVADPGVDTGHILRVRAWIVSGGTWNPSLKIQLVQGTHQDNATGEIALSSGSALTTTPTTYSYTLTSVQAAAITDYSQLQLRAVLQGSTGTGEGRVSWMEMETPPADAVSLRLTDALALSLDAGAAKTVMPTIEDEVVFSMLAPGLNDPERLIDAGRMFRVTRTRFSPKNRSAFVDFEDL